MNKSVHLISFDVPYPPNYGGVIDVYYKLKELNNLGVKIHLHTFNYGRGQQKELSQFCESVTYYNRNMSPLLLFSKTPFIVLTRKNKELLKNLNKNKLPIICEGIHTSFYLENLKTKTYVRVHNIEHSYFFGLAKSEKNIFKKFFFFSEAIKLYFFEKKLTKADYIFTISKLEQEYFLKNHGEKSIYIPPFHDSNFNEHKNTIGKFILWHGDLRVSDNIKAVLFLINVYKNTSFIFKIASSIVPPVIAKFLIKTKNIEFIRLGNNTILNDLLSHAHINVLYTYQNTGIKLKLLNALYKGKFVIGNDDLILNTGLENICDLANTKKEFLKKTKLLFKQEFTSEIIKERKVVLETFSPRASAKKIVATIFKL